MLKQSVLVLSYFRSFKRERIIVPLDRQFVVYPGVAGVDEGAGVEEVFLIKGPLYTQAFCLLDRRLLHWSSSTRSRVAGCFELVEAGVDEVGQLVAAGRGRF